MSIETQSWLKSLWVIFQTHFVVNAVSFIGILDQLVNGEGGVVGLDDGVGHLGREIVAIIIGSIAIIPYGKHLTVKRHETLTLGLGTTEKVFMILSGYSSRILEMRRVPIPLPVSPPKECVN